MKNDDKGTVYWITGLSGAGKTTVGTMFYEQIKETKDNVIRLDGDILRSVFLNQDYSTEGRKALGYEYSRLCKMIATQGIDVVICTVVMYDEVRKWNRENIEKYREVYLEVPIEELSRRDQKGLYSKAKSTDDTPVCGITLDVELPKNPDLVIRNYGNTTPEEACRQIIESFL